MTHNFSKTGDDKNLAPWACETLAHNIRPRPIGIDTLIPIIHFDTDDTTEHSGNESTSPPRRISNDECEVCSEGN
jgi:hypothetical protein